MTVEQTGLDGLSPSYDHTKEYTANRESTPKEDLDTIEQNEGFLSTFVRNCFHEVLRSTVGHELEATIDEVYESALNAVNSDSEDHIEALSERLKKLGLEDTIFTASAFSNLLQLQNASEEVSNAMNNRKMRVGTLTREPFQTTHRKILALMEHKVSPQKLQDTLCNQTVDLCLTAHPTQAIRRDLLRIFSRIKEQLDTLQRVELTHFEKQELKQAIQCNIQAAWRTDEIHRVKPSPREETRSGLSYVAKTIFPTLPTFMRRVDSSLKDVGANRLPLDHSLFRFTSWLGGDRDGNSNVDAECTKEAVLIARAEAADLYFKEVETLIFGMCMWRCTPAFKERVDSICNTTVENGYDAARISETHKLRRYADFWKPIPVTEPYRVVLAEVRDKLFNTREYAHRRLQGHKGLGPSSDFYEQGIYKHVDELLEPLLACYDSLHQRGDGPIADGHLLDLIRQVRCFGLSLVSLDIRQESERHTELLTAITRHIEVGSYEQWSEEDKQRWLTKELKSRRPLISPYLELSAEARETLDTFNAIKEITDDLPGALNSYVISMTRTASDVLAVLLLQREAGTPRDKCLPVVPLFETLNDLNSAEEVMGTLFKLEEYTTSISGKQEVMIGYSDSAKDAGRLASAWALYETQENLTKLATSCNIKLTLFHGRGGSVGRGGGPSHLGILSQPPETVNGSLRVTIQGEVIDQSFGHGELAFRSMDLFTSATLEHALNPPSSPSPCWRQIIQEMAQASCEEYRSIVFNTPAFEDLFQQVTPQAELGRLNIGSRPSKRKQGGIQSLRAIPWIFSWAQTRFHLPVWLGLGTAINQAAEKHGYGKLQEMCEKWPFFRVTFDQVEMILAKADENVFCLYTHNLIAGDSKELTDLSSRLKSMYEETVRKVLTFTRHKELLGGSALSMHSSKNSSLDTQHLLKTRLELREPATLALNILQVHCLRRLRQIEQEGGGSKGKVDSSEMGGARSELHKLNNKADREHSMIEDALQITIKGIASSQQNTG